MARPQIEDGHTKIANELVEALSRVYFSPAESKVFWAVLRKTYGWGKKTDTISYSQLELATGLDRRHIGPAIKRLIRRNIIIFTNAGERKISEYGVQKDYEKWLMSPESVTDLSNTTDTDLSNKSVTETGNNLLPKSATDGEPNLLPITVSSDTGLGKSVTVIGVKSVTDLSNHKSNKENTKAILQKSTYGEFLNVLLKNEEYEKLKEKIGQPHADDLIEQLSGYMRQSPANAKKYIDHYATILNWSRRDGRNGQHQNNPRKLPTAYTRPEDL